MSSSPSPSATDLRPATRATYAAFMGAGFILASWATRIPAVRGHLQLSPSALGLVLLATAAGSLIALPLSGPVVTRLGSRRTVMAMALTAGAGMVVVGLGYQVGVVAVVVGLFVFGFANGAWDVAMNVQGAVVERRLGRSIMSRFHAGFSLGTVAGALVGSALVAARVPVTLHLTVAAAVTAVLVAAQVRRFLPDEHQPEPATGEGAEPATPAADPQRPGALVAWREPRTLLIGVFVLAFAFAEGTGNDWISVAVIDGYQAPAALGTLAFSVFLAAMTLGRWFGPGLLDRFGRVPVVRVLAVVATAGLLLFVFGPTLPVAYLGALLWGLGTSLGFPVGMSAGSDEPRMAASRVSVIASIGYCAFLGGPPLIGFLGDDIGVLRALTSVAALLALAALIAAAISPLRPAPDGQHEASRVGQAGA